MSLVIYGISLCVVGVLVPEVYGYGSGAPEQACDQMVPKHGVSPQSVASPYKIDVEWSSNTTIRVTLSKQQESTPDFKGFLLKARKKNGLVSEYIGTFISYPPTTTLGMCGNDRKLSVTHYNTIAKNNLEFEWQRTQAECGTTIVFQATVVQNKTTLWTNILSEDIVIPLEPCEAVSMATTTAPTTPKVCDKTKEKCDTSSAQTVKFLFGMAFPLLVLHLVTYGTGI